jgi:hypothetical protein
MPSGVYPRTKEHIRKVTEKLYITVNKWNATHPKNDRWGAKGGRTKYFNKPKPTAPSL